MALNTKAQTVVVEYNGDDWWVMLDDGAVHVVGSPEEALTLIQRDARRTIKRGADVAVTKIEWRNAPAGFVPPTKGK